MHGLETIKRINGQHWRDVLCPKCKGLRKSARCLKCWNGGKYTLDIKTTEKIKLLTGLLISKLNRKEY